MGVRANFSKWVVSKKAKKRDCVREEGEEEKTKVKSGKEKDAPKDGKAA